MSLKIQEVSRSIKGRLIVNNVSINVNPGEVVGLMGPNGAGKTTTFNIAVGNIKPNKGQVIMNDKNITNLPLPTRSRLGLGYLTQEASIFRDLTVKDNIDLALQNSSYSRAAIRNRREQLINEFNLNNFVDNYGYQLSGGERRRCEIARALTVGRKGPKYLLLDEPFAGIDPIAIEEVKDTILKLKNSGIGIIVTDHNVREALKIVDYANIIYNGEIVKEGTPNVIIKDEFVKKIYLGENYDKQ